MRWLRIENIERDIMERQGPGIPPKSLLVVRCVMDEEMRRRERKIIVCGWGKRLGAWVRYRRGLLVNVLLNIVNGLFIHYSGELETMCHQYSNGTVIRLFLTAGQV